MKKISLFQLLMVGAIVVLVSCLTINIYFPEAAVQKTADEIVDEVRGKDEDKNKNDSQKDVVQSPGFFLIGTAYAQEAETVTTPKIRALKQSIKERFPQLKAFFNGGNIGEGNDGFVHIRNEEGLSLKDKASLRKLVKEENSDREALYLEVARALDISKDQVERIQKIFAKSWIEKSEPGWWVQRENGQWIKKPQE
ncbi:MAG: YdbL family protein [Acidobacteriota bacterium]